MEVLWLMRACLCNQLAPSVAFQHPSLKTLWIYHSHFSYFAYSVLSIWNTTLLRLRFCLNNASLSHWSSFSRKSCLTLSGWVRYSSSGPHCPVLRLLPAPLCHLQDYRPLKDCYCALMSLYPQCLQCSWCIVDAQQISINEWYNPVSWPHHQNPTIEPATPFLFLSPR